MYYFDPQDTEVAAGTGVIVETARGLEYGECVQGNTEIAEQAVVQPLKRMIRVATEADMKTLERNRKRADEGAIWMLQRNSRQESFQPVFGKRPTAKNIW